MRANAVPQTERDLATAYLKSDGHAIAQGVMSDNTLTNSTGKITTRADDIGVARKNDPKYEIFENYDMKVHVHGDSAVVTGKTHKKESLAANRPIPSFNLPTHWSKTVGAGVCSPATSQVASERKVARSDSSVVWR
jgi:hypothetical protein